MTESFFFRRRCGLTAQNLRNQVFAPASELDVKVATVPLLLVAQH